MMKRIDTALRCLIVLGILINACRPKTPEPIQIGKIWKAKTVKQNDVLVYEEGATNNAKPGYSRFRLDLTTPGTVNFMDIDGRKSTGTWTLSTDNKRLILENLTPPPSETSGNIEFYITGQATSTKLDLTRTNESRKTGNSVNAYELVPE